MIYKVASPRLPGPISPPRPPSSHPGPLDLLLPPPTPFPSGCSFLPLGGGSGLQGWGEHKAQIGLNFGKRLLVVEIPRKGQEEICFPKKSVLTVS